MKGFIFLVVNLAVSTVFYPQTAGQEIVDIGEDKDITEANKGSVHDDILEPPNIQRSATNNVKKLWTSPVPYVLDKGLEMNAKGVILRAFEQFRLKSCIDFKPRESEDYYISAQKLGGCFSYVGKVIPSGQILSIGKYCDEISTVEHEFLHALGFYHEQSRYDRDMYLTIAFENIQEGLENNFAKVNKESSTTNGVPYDYLSVMHYGKNAFSNGNGSTIITKDPKFQDVIGQRMEMSPSDVLELNLLYGCNSTIAFKMYCGFSNGTTCQMTQCSRGEISWTTMTNVKGGPSSDHTSLPSGSGDDQGQDPGHFMYAHTAFGQEGETALLETHKMRTSRGCNVQCLQFYYYHSGHETDQLNIWLREFQDEQDFTGTRRLVGQITGPQTSDWQLHHVSLNATKHFQVEFEVRKGAGFSSGGFAIDDINLSEIQCPDVTMQIDEFEKQLESSRYGTIIPSPRQYSQGGYSYRFGVALYRTYFGLYVQLLSGEYDDQLKWPCLQRQVTLQMLDQEPNIQRQMSKQTSITSDRKESVTGTDLWGNPREVGTPFVDENNQTVYGGPWIGKTYFTSLTDMKSRSFLKGGSAIFVFSFQDITPLEQGNVLPCPKVRPVRIMHPPKGLDEGSCSSRILTTTRPPTQTTDDNSIFGLSPGLVASPVLILMLTLMLLIH